MQKPLVDLRPAWLRNHLDDVTGVSFQCPTCEPEGSCFVEVQWIETKWLQRLWTKEGETFETLTIKEKIRDIRECEFDGEIKNGIVTWT